jgi:hypothetical protein
MHITREELLEVVLSIGFDPRLYSELDVDNLFSRECERAAIMSSVVSCEMAVSHK